MTPPDHSIPAALVEPEALPDPGDVAAWDAAAADEATDAELMRRMAERDATALAALYDRYSRYVYGICLRVLGRPADAEDTVVNVFLELWQQPDRYDASRGSLVPYLMILARSRATDLRRSAGRRRSLLVKKADELAPQAIDTTTPEMLARLRERRQQIQEAMASLSEVQREAVHLSFFAGLSHREIADQLDIPVGTIKTRIRMGLIQLRKSLRTFAGDQES